MTRALLLLLAVSPGCGESASTPTATSDPRDAGDAAFVRRVVPLMWGRTVTSNEEVALLASVAADEGRAALLDGMARDPAYLEHWAGVLMDAMAVSRIGFSANGGCYGRTLIPEPSGELAEHVRDAAPKAAAHSQPFTMRDLIHSALVLDDLSPVFRANLIASLARSIDDMHQLAAMSQRRNRAESFMVHYLDRRMACLGCHNSERAVTATQDPATNRHWPLPGDVDRALFGVPDGRDIAELSRFFRRKGVLAGYAYTHDAVSDEDIEVDRALGIEPWGWDPECGRFLPPDLVRADDVDLPGYFGGDRGEKGSVWDLEGDLATGFQTLRDIGPLQPLDTSVQPPVAFAWLVSASISHRVWEEAFGRRLTTAAYFPRNVYQRDTLYGLTSTFVTSGYSLRALIGEITGHPYFNAAVPEGDDDPRSYAPIFDPFVDEHLPIEDRRNDIGHTVRRAPSRVVMRSAHQALDWAAPPEFLLYYRSPFANMERDVGIFLKNGDPGFHGTSFQSVLAYETWFGLCTSPTQAAVCPLLPILDDPLSQTATVCELCVNRDLACAWDARCCDLAWEMYCSEECETGDPENIDLGIFPSMGAPVEADFVARLASTARDADATLEDAVATLKDRLHGDPRLDDPAERSALESLLGAPLTAKAGGDDELETRLRRVCGTLLTTPQMVLLGPVVDDVPLDARPPLTVDAADAVCLRIEGLFPDATICP